MEKLYKKKSKKIFYEKYAFRYFIRLSKKRSESENIFYILTEEEIHEIHQLRFKVSLLAGLLGSTGVFLLYIPYIFYRSLFWDWKIDLDFLGLIDLPIGFLIYGVILAIAEIAALMFLNLYAVHRIAYISGFPSVKDPRYNWYIDSLFEVGMEKVDKELLALGINPWQGLSRWVIFLYTLWNMTRATLSNVIIKLILARSLGRFAIRAYVDLIGIPIFAFWNIYTVNRVIREAKVRVLAPSLIQQFIEQIQLDLKNEKAFKDMLLESLQFIAITKRNFHHNHFLLAQELIQSFDIQPIEQAPTSQKQLIQKVKTFPYETRQALIKLLLFGILIDGKLSWREIRFLKKLQIENIILLDIEKLKEWEKSFLEGRGIPELLESELVYP